MSTEGSKSQSDDLDSNVEHILQTVIISGIIIALLWILTVLFGSELRPDSTLLFIALIPFIVWLIVSGRIAEIAGPGGIGIKLRNIAEKPVTSEDKITIEVERAQVIKKGGLQNLRAEISAKHPSTLSFVLGKRNYYNAKVVRDYLNVLQREPGFRFVLFVDSHRKFRGIMKASEFERMLTSTNGEPTDLNSDYEVVRMLETGSILPRPGVVTDYLEKTSTNKEALELMEKAYTDFVPVVDEQREYIGVVTQEGIMRKILTKLLST